MMINSYLLRFFFKKIVVYLLIFIYFFSSLVFESRAQPAYPAGSLLALTGVVDAAVYYIAEDGRKYVFPDSKTYYSWYSDFSDVKKVSVAELDAYLDGGAVTYRAGTKLITHENTAKVYAVEPGGILRWISSEEIAINLYGYNWTNLTQDVIPGYFSSSYKKGSDLGDKLPNGTIVRERATDHYYYIYQGSKRRFADLSAILKNNLNPVNILSVDNLRNYEDGPFILERENEIAYFIAPEYPIFFEEEIIIPPTPSVSTERKILFLTQQLGENLSEQGEINDWFQDYNQRHNSKFILEVRRYPSEPYPQSNRPYDFWNLWVNRACDNDNLSSQCLDVLAANYDMIIFKHSYDSADLLFDLGGEVAFASSQRQSVENYKLQYRELRNLFDQYPDTIFVALTLPPRHRLFSPPIDLAANTAFRAREFSSWLKNYWPKENNPNRSNVFVFDLRSYLSEDGFYLRREYELNLGWPEPLPNQLANETIGPLLVDFLTSTLKSFRF